MIMETTISIKKSQANTFHPGDYQKLIEKLVYQRQLIEIKQRKAKDWWEYRKFKPLVEKFTKIIPTFRRACTDELRSVVGKCRTK